MPRRELDLLDLLLVAAVLHLRGQVDLLDVEPHGRFRRLARDFRSLARERQAELLRVLAEDLHELYAGSGEGRPADRALVSRVKHVLGALDAEEVEAARREALRGRLLRHLAAVAVHLCFLLRM